MSKILIAVALLVATTAPSLASEWPSVPPGAFSVSN
jgi:hypothetical protein